MKAEKETSLREVSARQSGRLKKTMRPPGVKGSLRRFAPLTPVGLHGAWQTRQADGSACCRLTL